MIIISQYQLSMHLFAHFFINLIPFVISATRFIRIARFYSHVLLLLLNQIQSKYENEDSIDTFL